LISIPALLVSAGVTALADAITSNGTMTSINAKDNCLGDQGKVILSKLTNIQYLICDEWAITPDTTSLDLSKKDLKESDLLLLAGILGNNCTVLSLNIDGNHTGDYQLPDGWSYDPSLGECFRDRNDGNHQKQPPPGSKKTGGLAVAGALNVNTTLTKLNLAGNDIKNKGKHALASALLSNTSSSLAYFTCDQWSLLPNAGSTINFSNKGLEVGDAMLLAALLQNYTKTAKTITITSLDVSKNDTMGSGIAHLARIIPAL
jgi:hypothetical protein